MIFIIYAHFIKIEFLKSFRFKSISLECDILNVIRTLFSDNGQEMLTNSVVIMSQTCKQYEGHGSDLFSSSS